MRDIKVLIAGTGPLQADLLRRIEQTGLHDHCVLIGHEPNIMNLFAVVDVLIAPSVDYEDFPNVIVEAMGAGKAVIASRLAGAAEQILEGQTGLLLTPGSSDELAEAVCRLCKDRSLVGELGRNGQRRFQAWFTAEKAVDRYLAFYRSLIEAQ
jgi:glycosyltransferase involved in cell wall biosynthesis